MKNVVKYSRCLVALVLMGGLNLPVVAQDGGQKRHITPVKPGTNTVLRPAKGTSEEVIQSYIKGDTAAAKAKEVADSMKHIYTRYPLLTDVTVGVNFIDPLLMAFGQKHAGVDVSVMLNMWNRVQPVVEVGLGRASDTPDGLNYTYKGKLAPYARLGVNYNLSFKHSPQYQVVVGLRVGYSSFSYDVTSVSSGSDYWGENSTLHLAGLKSHALWGELLVGLRVGLWRGLSMGWQAKYHGLFNHKKNGYSSPWFVPGYGSRESSFAFSMSVYYTLPLSTLPKEKKLP